jgi:hypothetical protein
LRRGDPATRDLLAGVVARFDEGLDLLDLQEAVALLAEPEHTAS